MKMKIKNKIILFYSIWFCSYLCMEILFVDTYLNLILKYILYLAIVFFEYKNINQNQNVAKKSLFFFIAFSFLSSIFYLYNVGFNVRDILLYNFITALGVIVIYWVALFSIHLVKKYNGRTKYILFFYIIINPFVFLFIETEIPYFNITFDYNGNKRFLKMFDYNGNANSQYIEWDRLGNVIEKGYYKHGYKEGIWERFNSDGTLIDRENYDTVEKKILFKEN